MEGKTDKTQVPITGIKEVKEIHRTAWVNKQLPTIHYEETSHQSMTEGDHIILRVSGETAEEAIGMFRRVRAELNGTSLELPKGETEGTGEGEGEGKGGTEKTGEQENAKG